MRADLQPFCSGTHKWVPKIVTATHPGLECERLQFTQKHPGIA